MTEQQRFLLALQCTATFWTSSHSWREPSVLCCSSSCAGIAIHVLVPQSRQFLNSSLSAAPKAAGKFLHGILHRRAIVYCLQLTGHMGPRCCQTMEKCG